MILNNFIFTATEDIYNDEYTVDIDHSCITSRNPLVFLESVKKENTKLRMGKKLFDLLDENHLLKYTYFCVLYSGNKNFLNFSTNDKTQNEKLVKLLFPYVTYNTDVAMRIYNCLTTREKLSLFLNTKSFCEQRDSRYLQSKALNTKTNVLKNEEVLKDSEITLVDLKNMLQIKINLGNISGGKTEVVQVKKVGDKTYKITFNIKTLNKENENNLNHNKDIKVSRISIPKENIHLLRRNFFAVKDIERTKTPPCKLFYIKGMATGAIAKSIIIFIVTVLTLLILYKLH